MSIEKSSEVADHSKLYIAHLIACTLQGNVPEQKTDELTWEQIYSICKKHSITSTVYPAVKALSQQAGETTALESKLLNLWKEEYQKAMVKELTFDHARSELLRRLEEAQIKYMPLKGVILKDYYPSVGMRMFADNDILYNSDRMKDVQSIMEKMGYQTETIGEDNHDVYKKLPVLNFEMHRSLMSSNSPFYEYYSRVWERAKKNDHSEYGFHMTKEDFYLYFIVHAYKHYSHSGTGIRTVLDQFVFLQREEDELDWKYISDELRKLHLTEFEEELKELGLALFTANKLSDIVLTEALWEIYRYIFGQGTYGKWSNMIENRFTESREAGDKLHKSKLKYLIKRIFPTMKWMRTYFPVTKKYPFLYPVIIIIRLFRIYRKRKLIIAETAVVCKYDRNSTPPLH